MQNWKNRGVFGHIDKFWKGHDGQINKNACKNAYLGSIFIPEKYVFRVCFESPFTKMISSLKNKCPPLGEMCCNLHLVKLKQVIYGYRPGMGGESSHWLGIHIYACLLGCCFAKFGIAIGGFSSEMKEPKLYKLGVNSFVNYGKRIQFEQNLVLMGG